MNKFIYRFSLLKKFTTILNSMAIFCKSVIISLAIRVRSETSSINRSGYENESIITSFN